MSDSHADFLNPLISTSLMEDSSIKNRASPQSLLKRLHVESSVLTLLEVEMRSRRARNLLYLSWSVSLGCAAFIQCSNADRGYSLPSMCKPPKSATTTAFDFADLSRTDLGSLSLIGAAIG